MFGLLKTLVTLLILAMLIFSGATVELGDYTLFQHVARIWRTDETQQLVDDVRDESGPVVDKLRRGLQAGLHELRKDEELAGDPGREAAAELTRAELDAGVQADPAP